tara:strand:+ start:227 stop:631 length:405 start_codon:yes stop_codon:yes gene_type:complete
MKKLSPLLVNLFLSLFIFSESILINGAKLSIEISESDIERATGLMDRDTLSENSGMLFIWPEISRKCMWMKDTKIPLSVAYLDHKFLIREIKNLEPLSTESICSRSESIKYALEVNQGWFRKNNIKVFHKIIFK